jgi:anti-anti-sigma factor
MPRTLIVSDSTAPPQSGESAFGCTLDGGGRGAALVRVAGELDLTTAPRLERMLAEARRRARLVVVDLRGLTRVDISGVDAIVDASRSARRDGRRLVLVRGLLQVERLLALNGTSNAVEIVDLTAGEPTINALLHIARKDRVDTRRRARAPRRVATLLGASHVTRGIDALIGGGTRTDVIDG